VLHRVLGLGLATDRKLPGKIERRDREPREVVEVEAAADVRAGVGQGEDVAAPDAPCRRTFASGSRVAGEASGPPTPAAKSSSAALSMMQVW
jgi:hypothetical protein